MLCTCLACVSARAAQPPHRAALTAALTAALAAALAAAAAAATAAAAAAAHTTPPRSAAEDVSALGALVKGVRGERVLDLRADGER